MANSCEPKRPRIALRDGGEISPWSLRGIIGNVKSAMTPTPPTPEQAERDRQLADYKARAEAARSAPAQPTPAAAAPAPTGISGYVGNSALQARERAAGLRDGGDLRTGQGGNVPGTGSGDKIPAKYEPGEFVVSNAMLDAAPGLREELHDLRGNVLAKQGKSVAQADAEAVTPKGLRANDGGRLVPYVNHRMGDNAAQMMSSERAVGPNMRPNFVFGNNSAPTASAGRALVPTGQPGTATFPTKAPGTALVPTGRPGANGYKPNFTMGANPSAAPVAPSTAPQYTPPKVDPTTGRYLHEGIPGSRAGSGGGSWVRDTVRQGLKAQPGFGSKAGYLAGRVLSSPVTRFAGKAAGAAGVIQNFNDYKINDPEVDSSNSGTMRALGNGDFAGAGRSFSKGALEAGMDLGSFAANTADLFVPGQGPSKAYNRMLRDAFGDQLIDRSGNGPEGVQPRAASTAPAPRPIDRTGQGYDDPRRVNADPSRANLGASRDFTNELGAVPKDLPSDLREGVIHKTIGPNGTTVYSGRNVGADAQFVDGMGKTIAPRGGVMSSSALREGASADSGVSAALAAAEARGDMDSVRAYYANKGESFGGVSAAQYREQQEDAKAPKPGQPGYRTYMDAKMTKRGQDLDYDAALRGHEVTRGSAKYNADTALRDQFNKDRTFAADQEKTQFEQNRQSEKDVTDHVTQMFTKDVDGKASVDHAAANDFMTHMRQTAAAIAADPNVSPEDRKKYGRGMAGLDATDRAVMFNRYRIKQAQLKDRRGLTNPLGSTGDSSLDLRKYAIQGDASNLIQRRLRNEMGEVPDTTLEYGGDANHFFWNGGPADTSLIPPTRTRN